MASSRARSALNKGGLVIAVWVVLLHSSSGQQQQPAPAPSSPAPPPMGCSNCDSYCAQFCQKRAEDNARYCEAAYDPPVAYKGCFEGCTNSTCKGKTCAAHMDSCTIGTCDAEHCGTPCVQDCCQSCTSKAENGYYVFCLASMRPSSLWGCTNGCTQGCKQKYGCTGGTNGG